MGHQTSMTYYPTKAWVLTTVSGGECLWHPLSRLVGFIGPTIILLTTAVQRAGDTPDHLLILVCQIDWSFIMTNYKLRIRTPDQIYIPMFPQYLLHCYLYPLFKDISNHTVELHHYPTVRETSHNCDLDAACAERCADEAIVCCDAFFKIRIKHYVK